MIPKTIHYCWFGRNPKPKLAKKCIKSWKKYCKDYEIIEWNEDNFDISSAPLYVRQAYDAKKWAFVTDYVRLWAMVNCGGIYMDTDVEVIKPLDSFLNHRAFSGFEDDIHIPTGIMACEKGFLLFQEFLDYYVGLTFINEDGTYNTVPNVVYMTNTCVKYGLIQNNSFQIINGFALYPKDVFCPLSYETRECSKTKNTVTIHWFNGSWLEPNVRKDLDSKIKQNKMIHRKDFIFHIPNRILLFALGKKNYEKLKRLLK